MPKSAPQEQLSQQSQQLIFQLMHMGDRVTCIGVFNENIVRFWHFFQKTDQKSVSISGNTVFNVYRMALLWEVLNSCKKKSQLSHSLSLLSLHYFWDSCPLCTTSRQLMITCIASIAVPNDKEPRKTKLDNAPTTSIRCHPKVVFWVIDAALLFTIWNWKKNQLKFFFN